MRILTLALLSTLLADGGWWQWGRTGDHQGASPVAGQPLARIEAEIVLDPFANQEKAEAGGPLLVHYQAPLVDGNDVILVVKSGTYTGRTTRETQIWNVRNMRRNAQGQLTTQWEWASDWKPVPSGSAPGPNWEPVYHTLIVGDSIWAPGLGGTMHRLDRATGSPAARYHPFGNTVDPSIYISGPPAADAAGNIYFNAIQLAQQSPWTNDVRGAWLVKIATDGRMFHATIDSLTPNAPARDAQCSTQFAAELPLPPSPNAVAPLARCGPQRPGINIAPAIGPDGTVYTVSRSHQNDREAFLIAANPDLTPKWAASLRNRLHDGCNVTIPPNGTPGGCRAGTTTGVDPADNMPGSGRVNDNGTSSPVVLPDGRIAYGAYTRYNYAQGHLMVFEADGTYADAYGFGWDITPAVWEHDGTYSIVMKENRYNLGSYCGGSPTNCPGNRTQATPHDPEQYLITSLDPSLTVEWQYRNAETQSCGRNDDGSISCTEDHPNGFEWCVNAVAVDRRGVVYANAEDGYLYAINPNGTLRDRTFLRLALGAAYTPLSIGPDGRIYTQNDGRLFVVAGNAKQRAVRK
jgi:hypothetical protein